MSVEFCRESAGKFDSRTLDRKTLDRWTGHTRLAGAEKWAGAELASDQRGAPLISVLLSFWAPDMFFPSSFFLSGPVYTQFPSQYFPSQDLFQGLGCPETFFDR